MGKWLSFIIVGTLVGLLIVHGEVEAVKTGYDIRQLSMRKHELNTRVKTIESEIAKLTSYRSLEIKMAQNKQQLIMPEYKQIARVNIQETYGNQLRHTERTVFAKWLLPTANAHE